MPNHPSLLEIGKRRGSTVKLIRSRICFQAFLHLQMLDKPEHFGV